MWNTVHELATHVQELEETKTRTYVARDRVSLSNMRNRAADLIWRPAMAELYHIWPIDTDCVGVDACPCVKSRVKGR